MISDENLYERFWNGEPKVADELVHRHGDILILFIDGYLRGRQLSRLSLQNCPEPCCQSKMEASFSYRNRGTSLRDPERSPGRNPSV